MSSPKARRRAPWAGCRCEYKIPAALLKLRPGLLDLQENQPPGIAIADQVEHARADAVVAVIGRDGEVIDEHIVPIEQRDGKSRKRALETDGEQLRPALRRAGLEQENGLRSLSGNASR